MGLSKRAVAQAIRKAATTPTAPVDAPGTAGYEDLIANAAEARKTLNNNARRNS